MDKIQFKCKVCRKRSWFTVNNSNLRLFTKIVKGRRVTFKAFKCPKCCAEGVFRGDKNAIPFLRVKKIKIARRIEHLSIPSQLRLGDAR